MRHGIVATLSRRAALGFATSIVTLLACTGMASAASYTVNDTTDAPLATSTDTNCVSTQPGGTCTLRAAVQAANNVGGASTITVPAGTFSLSNGFLEVNTTGNGTAITVTGAGSGSTIVDGKRNDDIFGVDPNGGLSLSALTLQNGSRSEGGAIYSDGALAVTGDVLFKGNNSTLGGAIFSDSGSSSTLSLNGATFKGNSASDEGGAVADISPNLASVTNSTFLENSTFVCGGCGFDQGGAIYANNGALNVDHSTFSTNLSSNGGAIFFSGSLLFSAKKAAPVSGSAVSITNSSFTNNSAQSAGGCGAPVSRQAVRKQPLGCGFSGGGAIFDDGSSSMTLTGNQFTGNTAIFGGAAFLDSPGAYTVNSDEFDGNSAKEYGGAIDWESGSLSSTGSSFIDNTSAFQGGALSLDSGSLFTLVNATISGNSATHGQGGGMVVSATTPATLTNDTIAHNAGGAGISQPANFELTNGTDTGTGVSNTIVANNVGGDCVTATFAAGFDAGFNLDSDASCFGGLGATGDKTAVDAKLGTPADNGGSVLTDAELAGSPAIDGGTNTGCPATDARGVARPQGASCDIGAYELAPANLVLGKTAPASAVQGAAFTYTLTVTNGGPATSTGTTVVDQLPAGETSYGANPGQGTCTSSGSPAMVTCSLGSILPGGVATVTIVVSESKVGPVTNTATSTNDQSSTATASATTNITASSPASGGRPQAITGDTTAIGSTAATIHGQVIPNGTATQYFFQYGTGKSYGNVTTPQQVTSTTNVSARLTKLASSTTYHYRLVAMNGNGTSDGGDRTFKTKGHRFLGTFVLDNRTLHVRNGRVYATFTCKSSIACLSRFSIVIHALIAGTHKVGVLDFTTTRQQPRHFGANQTLTVSAPVTQGALAYLQAAANGQIGGKISARPRTNQRGLIELITLVLG